MDIRQCTRCIIQKDGEYLQGVQIPSGKPKYNNSPYDAWHTRELSAALRVARKVVGCVKLFNPIIGRVASLQERKAVRVGEV